MTVTEEIKPSQVTASPTLRRIQRQVGRSVERVGLPAIFAVMIVIFSILRPSTFPTLANFQAIATAQSVVAVAALALLFPLVAGRFDISVGATVGASSIATASAMSRYHLPLVAAIVIGVGLGLLIGVANGVLVGYLGVNSLITTLGTSTILAGLIQQYTAGVPISSGLSTSLTDLSVHSVFKIPALFIIMLGFAVVVWFVLTRSVYGRYLTSVGSNETAASLVGLPVRRIILLSFIASGGLGGCAGVLQIAAQGNGNPQVGGISFLLPALAAVFLGATTIVPGTYNVTGSMIALFFVGTAVSGLALLGVQSWVTDVFDGSAVIIAIVLSSLLRRRRTGSLAPGQ